MLSKNRIRKYKTWVRARPRTMPDARIGAKTTRQRLIWRGDRQPIRRRLRQSGQTEIVRRWLIWHDVDVKNAAAVDLARRG